MQYLLTHGTKYHFHVLFNTFQLDGCPNNVTIGDQRHMVWQFMTSLAADQQIRNKRLKKPKNVENVIPNNNINVTLNHNSPHWKMIVITKIIPTKNAAQWQNGSEIMSGHRKILNPLTSAVHMRFMNYMGKIKEPNNNASIGWFCLARGTCLQDKSH